MAKTMMGCPTTWSQQEGTEKPERDHQQGEDPDAIGGKNIADYDSDKDYEGSELEVEPDAQEQREVDPDAEYAQMEMSRCGTLCPRIIPWETYIWVL